MLQPLLVITCFLKNAFILVFSKLRSNRVFAWFCYLILSPVFFRNLKLFPVCLNFLEIETVVRIQLLCVFFSLLACYYEMCIASVGNLDWSMCTRFKSLKIYWTKLSNNFKTLFLNYSWLFIQRWESQRKLKCWKLRMKWKKQKNKKLKHLKNQNQ